MTTVHCTAVEQCPTPVDGTCPGHEVNTDLVSMLTESGKAAILSAVEFGFGCAEQGWNLERTMVEARKTLNQTLYAECLDVALNGPVN